MRAGGGSDTTGNALVTYLLVEWQRLSVCGAGHGATRPGDGAHYGTEQIHAGAPAAVPAASHTAADNTVNFSTVFPRIYGK